MAVSIGRVFCRLPRISCVVLCFCWPPLEFLLTGSAAMSQTPATPVAAAREFDCVIEPQQIVKLASPVVGMIARLDVDRGDIVRQDQVVGKIADGVEAAALALARARATNDSTVKSAEARLQFLRHKHERLDALHTKFVSSLAALQEAEAEARVAEQQLKEAQLNKEIARLEVTYAEEVLNQRTLRSPINGVVIERLLVPGEYRNDQSRDPHARADRPAEGRSLRAHRILRANPYRQQGRGATRTAGRRDPYRHRHGRRQCARRCERHVRGASGFAEPAFDAAGWDSLPGHIRDASSRRCPGLGSGRCAVEPPELKRQMAALAPVRKSRKPFRLDATQLQQAERSADENG